MGIEQVDPHVLLDSASRYQPHVERLLADLVKIPSVNGQHSEKGVAERILAEAHRLDLVGKLVAVDPNRPNVLVTAGSGDGGFALIGHMDTVSTGDDSGWSNPPFSAHVRQGRMFGRGVADNKAGLAIGIYTLAMLRDMELLPPGRGQAVLAGVVDEESGASSRLGVRALLDSGHLVVDGAIYTYASDIVCVGHRGLLRFNLVAKGRAIHTGSDAWSQGKQGVNAVTGLAEILLALEQLELPYTPHAAFDHLGFTITPGTLFQGGVFESMVPESATALVDVRLMPGQDADDAIRAVQKVIGLVCSRRRGLQIDMRVKNRLPAAAIPDDHRLATTAQRYARRLTGKAWPIRGAGPANEGYMLIQAGIPTLPGFGPDGGNAHAVDEWVSVESLPLTMAIYAGIINDYLPAA